jgi:hypothetical protein
MKIMIKNMKWLLLISLTMIACNDDDEAVVNNTSDGLPLTAGTADFSKYVALGDSLLQDLAIMHYLWKVRKMLIQM